MLTSVWKSPLHHHLSFIAPSFALFLSCPLQPKTIWSLQTYVSHFLSSLPEWQHMIAQKADEGKVSGVPRLPLTRGISPDWPPARSPPFPGDRFLQTQLPRSSDTSLGHLGPGFSPTRISRTTSHGCNHFFESQGVVQILLWRFRRLNKRGRGGRFYPFFANHFVRKRGRGWYPPSWFYAGGYTLTKKICKVVFDHFTNMLFDIWHHLLGYKTDSKD